jgi:hypothetical protein
MTCTLASELVCPRCGYRLHARDETDGAVEADRCSECGLAKARSIARSIAVSINARGPFAAASPLLLGVAAGAVLLHGFALHAGLHGTSSHPVVLGFLVVGRAMAAFSAGCLIAGAMRRDLRFGGWRWALAALSIPFLILAGMVTLAVGLYAHGILSLGSWFDRAMSIDFVQRCVGWSSPLAQIVGSAWLLWLTASVMRGCVPAPNRPGRSGGLLAAGLVALAICGLGLLVFLAMEIVLREQWLLTPRWALAAPSLMPWRLPVRMGIDAAVGLLVLTVVIAAARSSFASSAVDRGAFNGRSGP